MNSDNLTGIQPDVIYAEYIFKASITCWQKPDISTEQQNNKLVEIPLVSPAGPFPNNGVKEGSWKWIRLKSKHSFPQPDSLCLVQIKLHHHCKSTSAKLRCACSHVSCRGEDPKAEGGWSNCTFPPILVRLSEYLCVLHWPVCRWAGSLMWFASGQREKPDLLTKVPERVELFIFAFMFSCESL